MFKLSKESKLTFICLLIVPLIWIVLNHFGLLDFLEYKSVDLRFKARGNLSHREQPFADERVNVEDNKTVPRIPKVIYANFDSDTLSMDEVGERSPGTEAFSGMPERYCSRKERRESWLMTSSFPLRALQAWFPKGMFS